jgi:ABC-type multidrug transport system ATPase subunit
MTSAITLEKVSKQFGQFTTVDNLSMEVKAGEIYGFLGPNGSGKSTTLRMLLSLIQPTSGKISVFGHDMNHERDQIMGKIGCIIEKPDFYGYLSARKNIELMARASGIRYTAKDYDNLFEQVGLSGREQDKVKTYSHGMKQRLGLAQALIHNPDLIILDEPNTGLDPQGIIDLRNLLVKLNREQGKTILLSSHILSEIEEIAHSMIVLNKGQTVAQGRVQELLSNEDLHVEIETEGTESTTEKTSALIRSSAWQQYFAGSNGSVLRFNLSKPKIAALNDFLVTENIPVLRIEYKRQLEEYFLKMTHA